MNPLPHGLEVPEALLTLRKGKTNMVQIELINNTNHDINVCGRTVLGSFHLVQSVTPLNVKLQSQQRRVDVLSALTVPASEPQGTTEKANCPTGNEEPLSSIPQYIKDIDVGDLRRDQK